MTIQKTLFGFTFEDVQGDPVDVHNGGGAVEIEFKQVNAGETNTIVLYFDRTHVPAFQEIIKLLQSSCPHNNTVAEPVPGDTITICQDCGNEL